MACKPRLHYAGAVYHVMVQGNGGPGWQRNQKTIPIRVPAHMSKAVRGLWLKWKISLKEGSCSERKEGQEEDYAEKWDVALFSIYYGLEYK